MLIQASNNMSQSPHPHWQPYTMREKEGKHYSTPHSVSARNSTRSIPYQDGNYGTLCVVGHCPSPLNLEMANNWHDQQTGLSMSRLSQLSEMVYASPPQPGNVELRPAVFDRFSPQPLTENPNPSHTTTRPANLVLRISPGPLF